MTTALSILVASAIIATWASVARAHLPRNHSMRMDYLQTAWIGGIALYGSLGALFAFSYVPGVMQGPMQIYVTVVGALFALIAVVTYAEERYWRRNRREERRTSTTR